MIAASQIGDGSRFLQTRRVTWRCRRTTGNNARCTTPGRVQGVGFRYTVRSLAVGFDVTGFVRNLPDGRVHLVVEGGRRGNRRDPGCRQGGNGVLYR